MALSEVNAETPTRNQCGWALRQRQRGLLKVGQADTHTLNVAQATTGAHRPRLAESNVHTQAEGEAHVIVATAENRNDYRMGIRSKRGPRALQFEPPAEGYTHREEEQVRPIAQLASEAHREGAVKRE